MRKNISRVTVNSTRALVDSDSFGDWLWSLTLNHMLYVSVTWILVPVGVLGLITNSLNVIGFVRVGLQDSATICFFALSASDLCFTLMVCTKNSLSVIGLAFPDLLVNIGEDAYWATYYMHMAFDSSSILRTLIAVIRACCVVLPFHVKRMFSTSRTVSTVLFICTCNIVSYVSFEFLKIKRLFTNEITNTTYVADGYIDGWEMSQHFRNIFNKMIVVCVCEVFVGVSLVLIVCGMLATSNYHQSLRINRDTTEPSSQLVNRLRKTSRQEKMTFIKSVHNIQETIYTVKRRQSNKKEMRVIQQVAILSSLHLICNTFEVGYCVLSQIMDVNNNTYIFMSVHWALEAFNRFTGPANAASNFFIYYVFNSKFRQAVYKMCRARSRN
ncbi:hypothetical protein BsWGS_08513 [Bradybaena similaris]